MIRRIERKIKPRKPKAKLKYSYRPRLRPILSSDTRIKRRAMFQAAGLGRKILVLALVGTAGFVLHEKGVYTDVKARVSGYFAEMKAPKRAIPAKPRTDVKPAPTVAMRARNFWNRRFGPEVREETPVAFVKLDELYGIGASGTILRISGKAVYDMPVISGDFHGNKKPGDTLNEARLALSIVKQAGKNAPWLLKKTSEIILKDSEEARLLFTDNRLTAYLGPRDVEKQTANLAAYLGVWDKEKAGTINMMYGDIAFITEEGENDK
jgi:hypothetical protein